MSAPARQRDPGDGAGLFPPGARRPVSQPVGGPGRGYRLAFAALPGSHVRGRKGSGPGGDASASGLGRRAAPLEVTREGGPGLQRRPGRRGGSRRPSAPRSGCPSAGPAAAAMKKQFNRMKQLANQTVGR